MAGQWERECIRGYADRDADVFGVGNGNDDGSPADDNECGSVGILSGDVQFHEYGGCGELWVEFNGGEWGWGVIGEAGTGNGVRAAGIGSRDFYRGNRDPDVYKYGDEYGY